MTDTLTPEQRSERMGRVRGADTKPEKAVRSLLHAMGYRFRLHRTDLPGKPDIVLPKYRAAIFVHGCFWHRHDCPSGRREPKSNQAFWRAKFEANVRRDARKESELAEAGWRVLTVWECEVTHQEELGRRLRDFLEAGQ